MKKKKRLLSRKTNKDLILNSCKSDLEASQTTSSPDSLSVASSAGCDCCCSLREFVGIDCEFVGVGPGGKQNGLGRVTIVDASGNILYDQVALPERDIVDYRTRWSGLRPSDFTAAIPEEFVKRKVRDLLKDCVVVGHMVKNDFHVLQYRHTPGLVRDTALYAPLRSMCNPDVFQKRPMSLKKLTKALLDRDIQNGEHDSAEDARATMDLYQLVAESWEAELHRNGCPLLAKPKKNEPEDPSSGAIAWFSDEFWPEDD